MLSTRFSIRRRSILKAAGGMIGLLLTSCGGSSGGSPGDGQNNNTNGSPATSPQIILHPLSQTVELGGSVIFEVSASGTSPLMYQWQRDGFDIPGAVGTIYSTPQLTLQDDGRIYAVRVLNREGAVQSNTATVNVSVLGITVDSTFATADALSIAL